MRQVRDALLRTLAFGHVLDDSEHILGLALVALDCEPAREDVAHTSGRSVDLTFVEDRLIGLQQFVLTRCDPISLRF